MAVIRLNGFSGMAPRVGPTELQANQAQMARNAKLQSGEIRPWRKPVLAYTPGLSDVHTIHRLENTAIADAVWLEWGVDTDVVASPVADTTDFRVYYTDGVLPKKTNWDLATTGGTGVKPFPNAYLALGVPAPTTAPTLTATTGTAETRVYVYTYVSSFGSVEEESAPSPAATIALNTTTTTVTVNGFATAPTSATHRNITSIRIYRSVSSAATASYLYVGSVTVDPVTGLASGPFTDNVAAANLGFPLASLYYSPPPDNLQGIVAMPNGILAGFTDNQVWFSEPYLPHAWPTAYMMTVGFPIVGLGVFGQSLVVCTSRNPYLITGSQPGAMTQEKIPLPEPCISKKSIASDQFGVLYASPNGLVSIGQGTQDVVTRALFTRDEWQKYLPATLVGVIYQNMYLGFYQVENTKAALIIMRGDTPPLVTLEVAAQAVFVERTTANVFYVSPTDNLVYQLDADLVNTEYFEWKSKKFILPEPTNFGVAKVQADWTYIRDVAAYNAYVQSIIDANQALWDSGESLHDEVGGYMMGEMVLGGSLLQPIPTEAETRVVQAVINADDAQFAAVGFTTQEPERLPGTRKSYVYEIKLTGNAPIREFVMATTVGELKQA